MRLLVESLRRNYLKGTVSLNTIKDMVARGKITTAEYDYIVGAA